ncbi:MAG: hypothetical protein K0R57_4650 [Paenibacillaceae bacterium]|nr:hypothetical protein [Paenibacillaceae bacterium]
MLHKRTPLPEGEFPPPSIAPPAAHPRLLFTAADIPAIRTNIQAAQNRPAAEAYAAFLQQKTDGMLPQSSFNFDAEMLGHIEALAFDYAIYGNAENGRQAVAAICSYLSDVKFKGMFDSSRAMGHVVFACSEVYDWCYPLLSEEDRQYMVHACEEIIRSAQADDRRGMEIGYPPSGQSAITGHAGEAQMMRDLLSFGIAVYDEYPDIYNYTAGRFFTQFIEPRNFWYRSHSHHQGCAYGPYRFLWDLWSAYIFKAMTGDRIYIPEMERVAYEWIYTSRPDGQLMRNGDDFVELTTPRGQTYIQHPMFLMAAGYFGNAHFKYEGMDQSEQLTSFIYKNTTWTPVQALIMNDPHLEGEPWDNLPCSVYLPSPKGAIVARTGWSDQADSPPVIAVMNIGEYWASNHHHLDAGSFQLYYKGILASESGAYNSYYTEHDKNYNKRTVAHNTLLIHDPGETTLLQGYDPLVNEGGQRLPNDGWEPADFAEWMGKDYKTGSVLEHAVASDSVRPGYAYIKGDITQAYSGKVREVLRSMLFMPLDDPDHPAVMIVLDKVTAADRLYKKSYLLHTQQEPEIKGNRVVAVNDRYGNNGRLVHETLLPSDYEMVKIGGPGHEFEAGGVNFSIDAERLRERMFEGGWGRVEISPAEPRQTDYFLHVMTVSDADTTAPDLCSTLMEGEGFTGVVVSDRIAILAKDAGKRKTDLIFTPPDNRNYSVLVTGLKEGTWRIEPAGEEVEAITGGHAVSFSVQTEGTVTLHYANGTQQ